MKIRSVHAVGLKGRDQNIPLNGLDVFHGPNGSGKSTMLSAIKIALLGHDPVVGATNGATWSMASPGADRLTIGMNVRDGSRTIDITRDLFVRGRAGTIGAELTVRDGDMIVEDPDGFVKDEIRPFAPAFDPSAFLALSPEKRREFLAPFLPDFDTSEHHIVVAIYRAAVGDDAVRTTAAFACDMSPETSIDDYSSAAIETLAKALREKTPLRPDAAAKELDALRAWLTRSFPNGIGSDALPALLDHLREQAKLAKGAVTQAEATARDAAKRRSEAAHHRPVGELREERASLSAQRDAAVADRAASIEREKSVAEKTREMDRLKEEKAGLQTGVDLDAMRAKADAQIAEIRAKAEEREDAVAALNAWDAANAETSNALRDEISALSVTADAHEKSLKFIDDLSGLDARIECPKCGHLFDGDYGTQRANSEACWKAAHDKVLELERDAEAMDEERRRLARRLESLEMTPDLAESRIAEIERFFAKAKEAEEHRLARVGEIEARITELSGEITALPVIDDTLAKAQEDGLAQRIAALDTEIEAAMRAQGVAEAAEQAKANAASASARLEFHQTAEKAVRSIRSVHAARLAETITSTANELLTAIDPRFAMRLVLEDAKGRDTLDIEMTIDGVARPALLQSGGESVVGITVALGAALVALAKPACRVLLVEAAELDDRNFAALLAGCRKMLDTNRLDNVVVATCAAGHDRIALDSGCAVTSFPIAQAVRGEAVA